MKTVSFTSAPAQTQRSNSNSDPAGDWLFDSRRRRRRGGRKPRRTASSTPLPFQTLTLGPPSPWSPSDLDTDPDRESRLLKRMHSSIDLLETSHFYRRFLSRFRTPQIQDGLKKILASGSQIQLVVYGIGSIESYASPRIQLALAVLLRRELADFVASVEVFDPVLSAAECAVVEALGCTVIRHDERGRREAVSPTLFYMPHCEAVLYDNLLDANWRPEALNRMVVLGNSFGMYEFMGGMVHGTGSGPVQAAARHMVWVSRYAREVGMEEKKESGEEDDEDDGFCRAFHDMSWHFFELEEDIDMNLLKK